MAKKNNPITVLNYEQAQTALEEVITALENDPVNLEASVALFEKGKELIKHCQVLLDTAELKVRQLGADGSILPLDE